MLTPVSPVSSSVPRAWRSGRLQANDGRDVVLRLNGSLGEAFSSLQQHHWLDRR